MNVEMFWSRVDKSGPYCKKLRSKCWVWTGTIEDGYGKYGHGPGTRLAHRIAYRLMVGPVRNGYELDHLCRRRNCVNPKHLEPAKHRENILRGEGVAGKAARKTHCIRGHKFTKANTYRPSDGGRRCRTCKELLRP